MQISGCTFQSVYSTIDVAGVLTSQNAAAAVYITNSVVSNSSSISGGVLYALGSVSVSGCTFTNVKSSGDGGALWSGGNINVSNSSIYNSGGAKGGALFSYASIAVDGSTFNNCTASNAGGVMYASSAVSKITVTGSTFTTAKSSGSGGAIYSQGSLAFTNSSVIGSTSGNSGGALYGSSVSIAASLFTGCSSSQHGGAIYVAANGTTTLSTTQFQSNTANINGSAVYIAGGEIYHNSYHRFNRAVTQM